MRMRKRGNAKRKGETGGVLTGDAVERRGWQRETAEGWLISQCSGTVTWSAPAPAAAELNPLNSLRPRTGVNGCLHSLPFTLKHTHTHSSILKQPLIRVIMRNIVPTSSFQGFVCLYWGNLRNSRQKSFACFIWILWKYDSWLMSNTFMRKLDDNMNA